MKPGVSAQRTGTFPHAIISRVARAATPGSVDGATTTSTSGMTGAGLKKWSPSTRAGWTVARAIASTDRALVFVARMAFGPRRRIERAQDRALRGQVLEHGLDDQARVRIGQDVQRGCRPQAREAAVDPRLGRIRIEIEPPRPSLQARPDPATAALDGGRVDVVDQDLVAGFERELGDPGAHRPGPDDADELDRLDPRLGHGQTGLMASNGWRQSAQ